MRLLSHHSGMRIIAMIATIVAGTAPITVASQSVLVAPNVVVIDGHSRTTAITLVNTGNAPAEVSLSTAFGYPVSDSRGAMRLQTSAVVDYSMPSAAEFVHAYPSDLVLAPGARRVVRLLASPPAGTPDGEYWARLVVTTRSARTGQAELASDASASHIGIDLEIRSMLALFYRQGAVTTGVAIDSLRATVADDSVRLRVPLIRLGNAAFVGSVRATLRDSVGAVRSTSIVPLGVYFDLTPAIALNRKGLRPGVYELEIEASTRRPDAPAQLLTQAAPVRARTPIILGPVSP